jgi:RES domain-containing protein
MFVYRISQTRYANLLNSPGFAARWNSEGSKMLYTAGSLALSCLEVLAHKSGTSLYSGDFSVAIIEIGESVKIKEITLEELQETVENWYSVDNYPITQAIGDRWLSGMETAVFKVPSAIIDLEYNYLLNVSHPDFSKIRVAKISKFTFDPRLKANP